MRPLTLTLLLTLWLPPLAAGDNQPTQDQIRFFETSIRPLLSERCYKCHGPEKQRADLRLDSRVAILKGGESGPAVIVGEPEKSLLLRALQHENQTLKMPPDDKLSPRQIGDLASWVKMGLPYPQGKVAERKEDPQDFWAFKPPVAPPIPAVKNRAWPKSPLDHFVLAQLEQKGLQPAPPAKRPALIRRATFDLIGLPPTQEEIEAFVNDKAPDAFARVVDRLLASPHYGERWGRHWLDVARYADSNGLDENVAFGNAWRYRDYVVAAFNRDKPYDQFLLEQIAGDLLPLTHPIGEPAALAAGFRQPAANAAGSPAKGVGGLGSAAHERLIATGFLSLGPKVLAEPDQKKMEMDIIDEQVDTVGRAVLGLTLGCARCHDHKFDPISTKDYYGLAGIFQSTRTMEHFKIIARWHEHSLASEKEKEAKAAHDKLVAERKAEIQKLTKKGKETEAEVKRLREELTRLEKSAPELPSAFGVGEGKVVDTPVHIRGNHLKLGPVVPRRVPEIIAGAQVPTFDTKQSGRLQLAQWLIRRDHPLTARVMVNRLWRWHFGQGLVRTPDNFGRLGERPTNQPLLDWLAVAFASPSVGPASLFPQEGPGDTQGVARSASARRTYQDEGLGWSIKAMHRLIVLSATYQMSAASDERALQVDPDNRLHWRANVRRLEAEALRDALLAVSGQLDRTMGGSMLHVKNREFLFDHTSKDTTKYDSRRRSLYLPVIRNHLYDVFQLFDYPDPAVSSGDRATTTVAPQALFLLNSDWVGGLCEEWAKRLLNERDGVERIRQIYRTAYGREPTAAETERARALVRGVEKALQTREPDERRRRVQAWASLCQVVVAGNEFVYVE